MIKSSLDCFRHCSVWHQDTIRYKKKKNPIIRVWTVKIWVNDVIFLLSPPTIMSFFVTFFIEIWKRISVIGNLILLKNKELKKAIFTRSRLRNIFWKYTTKKNELNHSKKQWNRCVSVRKKIIKLHFQYIFRDGTVGNKVSAAQWNFIQQ